jgi:hypothetical protein
LQNTKKLYQEEFTKMKDRSMEEKNNLGGSWLTDLECLSHSGKEISEVFKNIK